MSWTSTEAGFPANVERTNSHAPPKISNSERRAEKVKFQAISKKKSSSKLKEIQTQGLKVEEKTKWDKRKNSLNRNSNLKK